jgi:hypothetical protein
VSVHINRVRRNFLQYDTGKREISFKKEDGMQSEQVGNPYLEESPTDCLSLEIEELELIAAPGITWSV